MNKPDYKISFGIPYTKELLKQGYVWCGSAHMDNGVEGEILRKYIEVPDEERKEAINNVEA
jgi:hypothetical protein